MKNGSEALASQKEAISKQEAGLKSRFQIDLVEVLSVCDI